jgi:hypothetical protein
MTPPGDLEDFVHRIVHPIAASPRRKQIIQEELLAHLMERSASDLGDPDELRQQLQSSVPLVERTVYRSLAFLEPLMTRLLWIAGLVAFTAGAHLHFTLNIFVQFAGLLLLCALMFKHFCAPDNVASRVLGRRWPWYVAATATVFGAMMILPAWAQLNRGQSNMSFVPLVTGAAIALGGLGLLAHTIHARRPRVA